MPAFNVTEPVGTHVFGYPRVGEELDSDRLHVCHAEAIVYAVSNGMPQGEASCEGLLAAGGSPMVGGFDGTSGGYVYGVLSSGLLDTYRRAVWRVFGIEDPSVSGPTLDHAALELYLEALRRAGG